MKQYPTLFLLILLCTISFRCSKDPKSVINQYSGDCLINKYSGEYTFCCDVNDPKPRTFDDLANWPSEAAADFLLIRGEWNDMYYYQNMCKLCDQIPMWTPCDGAEPITAEHPDYSKITYVGFVGYR